MDEILIINKQIKKVVFELIFAILLFTFAFIIWITPNSMDVGRVAATTLNTGGSVALEQISPLALENIYPVDDEYAITNYDKAILKLTNNSGSTSRYILSYRVYNNSTLDTKFLKFQLENENIDTRVDFMSNLGMNLGSNYIDYVLYSGEIAPNKSLEFKYLMWIDHNVGNEAQNKNLSAQFVVNSYDASIGLK